MLVCGGLALALPFLGVVMLFGMAFGAIAFMLTVALAIKQIKSSQGAQHLLSSFTRAMSSLSESSPVTTQSAKNEENCAATVLLWDMHGMVCVFSSEPTIQELLLANNKQKDISGLIRVPNNQQANILLNSGKDAIKIKLLGGHNNGQVGWVGRSNIAEVSSQA